MPGVVLLGGLAAALVLAAAPAVAQDEIRLDNHTKTYAVNKLAPGWDDRFDLDKFQFVHEGDQHHIYIYTGKNGSGLMGSERGFKLKNWRVLEWEWKVTQIPKGGDVRNKNANDQAGNMCVAYDPGFVTFDKFVCYLFENEGPIGAEGVTSTNDDVKFVIIRAADTDKLGEWYKESRNIYEDFKRLWGVEPEDEAAIGMYVDADDTETSAEVYFRNIYLKRR